MSAKPKQAARRRRKGEPFNPGGGRVHVRKSTDLLRNADVAPWKVPDPFDPEDEIEVLRSLRDDPFARMHSKQEIDQAQYDGGLAFQRDYENAERGPRAIDPGKEFVDGGQLPEPITESQQKSARRLAEVYRRLGMNGSAIVHDVIVYRLSLPEVARKRGMTRDVELIALRQVFWRGLDELAILYGKAMGR